MYYATYNIIKYLLIFMSLDDRLKELEDNEKEMICKSNFINNNIKL